MRNKPLLVLLLSTCFATFAFAQIPVGTWLVGGDFYYGKNTITETNRSQPTNTGSGTTAKPSAATTNTNKITRFSATPVVQYTFADNWLLGLGAGYTHNRFESQQDFVEITRTRVFKMSATYAQRIFLRGFFLNELGFSGALEDITTGVKITSTAKISELTYRPGIAYFFQDRLGVVVSIGAIGVNSVTKDTGNKLLTTTDAFFSLMPNTATVGLRFLINGKVDEDEVRRREQEKNSGSRYF
jgi:hypothetical protein